MMCLHKFSLLALPVLGTLLLMPLVPPAFAQDADDEAAHLFRDGQFAAAEISYKRLVKSKPEMATHRLGQIALLENRLPAAERWLKQAQRLSPSDPEPQRLLAETYYRQLKFAKAATLFRTVGDDAKARQLESFAGRRPYRLDRKLKQVNVKFLQTDPLPLVEVRLNKGDPIYFLIDTGAAEIIIDDESARQIKVPDFGGKEGVFAGGKKATIDYGRLDSLTLGGLTVENIPVAIQSTQRYSAIAQGRRVSGIIGTVFLYQFLSTLNYSDGELVLAPRSRSKSATQDRSEVSIPFWLASDHFILAKGSINDGDQLMMLVDTGLAGMGLTAPRKTLETAHIDLSGESSEGIGGGGKVHAVVFQAEKVSLGSATQEHITGVLGPFPPSLEGSTGVHIDALISHQFFRPYKLTFDFKSMRLELNQGARR